MTQSQQVPSKLSGRVCNGLRISPACLRQLLLHYIALKPAKTVHMAQVSIDVVVDRQETQTSMLTNAAQCTVIVLRSSSQTRFVLLNAVCLLDYMCRITVTG